MIPRAFLCIRQEPHYRRASFEAGLRAAGYDIWGPPREPARMGDVLVIWNRYAHLHATAQRFEREGGTVIVAENGLLGRDRPDGHWYSLALDRPAGCGGHIQAPDRSEMRSHRIGCKFGEWRQKGNEVIVLEQRGIGPPGIASPAGWADRIASDLRRTHPLLPVRVRRHPGEKPATPLEEDLREARCVVTWASGAALRALDLGVPVFYEHPNWIGADGARPFGDRIDRPRMNDSGRSLALAKAAEATWRTDEIETGEPFVRLRTAALRRACTPSGATTEAS